MTIPARIKVIDNQTVVATSGTYTSEAIEIGRGNFFASIQSVSAGSNIDLQYSYALGDGTNFSTFTDIGAAITTAGYNNINMGNIQYDKYIKIKVSNTGAGDATVTARYLFQEDN